MERTYIDIYCERIEPGLWAEPLNAITNLAFIIAAFLLIRMILRSDPAIRRFAAAPAWVCALGVAGVLGLAMAVPPLTGFRGGSYVAALTALVIIGGFLKFGPKHAGGTALLMAAAIFAVSLTFRTVDAPICAAVPIGTHFMWHLLNGCVLFIVVRALVLFGRRV